MPSHRMAAPAMAPGRRAPDGHAGGRHRGAGGPLAGRQPTRQPAVDSPSTAAPGRRDAERTGPPTWRDAERTGPPTWRDAERTGPPTWRDAERTGTAARPRPGGGHRAARPVGRRAYAAPAPSSGGAHRDPLAAGGPFQEFIVPAAATIRELLPPAVGVVRRFVPSATVGLRRLGTEPRLALVAALIAGMVLITGQAQDGLNSDAERVPTATAVDAPAGPRAAGAAPAQRGTTRPDPANAPPATAGASRPPASASPSARPADAPTPAGATPTPGADPGRPVGAATPSLSPSSARPGGSGPAGSLRRTGGTGVAVTFDDGPDPDNTPRLLDLLRQHDVRATFCVVGSRARAHPELVRRIAADGHTLCSHSWDHSFSLGLKPIDEIRTDLEATNEAIRAAVPNARISHFRAPGGFFTPRLVAVAAQYGMKSQYWEVDPRDWEKPLGQTDEGHIDRIIKVVQAETRPGSMILSHDFQQPTTITAYEILVPWLKERFDLIALPA